MEQKKTNLYRELIKYPDIVSFLKGTDSLQGLFEVLPNLSEERVRIYQEIYSGVGNTPVTTIQLPNKNTLFVKRECDNGMGNNHYSRYWIIHLALAEAFGLIKVGESTILEITSGSSGISLSMACEKLGYQLKIIVPETLPKGRIDAMTRECTTIVKVPGYIGNCREFFMEEKNKADYYLPNHSEEKADLIAMVFSRIAIEFLRDNGSVDNVIVGLGNGSSTYAVANKFRSICPDCMVYSYYPSASNGKIVYGLYADNLSFIHILRTQKEGLINAEFYTDHFDLEDIYTCFQDYSIIKEWGMSSIYALGIAYQLSKNVEGKSFFSIAYDRIDRYAN